MGAATLRNDGAESFRAGGPVETVGNSLSLRCLNDAIDASGIPAKVLAARLEVSEGEFSKLRAGRFRLEQIDRLPEAIRADWETRVEAARAAVGASRDEIIMARAAHALIDALAVVKGRARMAKARLG